MRVPSPRERSGATGLGCRRQEWPAGEDRVPLAAGASYPHIPRSLLSLRDLIDTPHGRCERDLSLGKRRLGLALRGREQAPEQSRADLRARPAQTRMPEAPPRTGGGAGQAGTTGGGRGVRSPRRACRPGPGPLGAARAGPERGRGGPQTSAAASGPEPPRGRLRRVAAAPDPTPPLAARRRGDAEGPATHAPPAASARSVRKQGGGAARTRMQRATGASRGARRDLPHLVGGGRPRGPMGAEPGRPAPRRRTSGPGYGRRRCRVLELSVRRRELTAALKRPRGRAEAPPGVRGAAAAAEEEASAGGWSSSHRWAHGVHLTEELPWSGARLHPGAPHRRPER